MTIPKLSTLQYLTAFVAHNAYVFADMVIYELYKPWLYLERLWFVHVLKLSEKEILRRVFSKCLPGSSGPYSAEHKFYSLCNILDHLDIKDEALQIRKFFHPSSLLRYYFDKESFEWIKFYTTIRTGDDMLVGLSYITGVSAQALKYRLGQECYNAIKDKSPKDVYQYFKLTRTGQ